MPFDLFIPVQVKCFSEAEKLLAQDILNTHISLSFDHFLFYIWNYNDFEVQWVPLFWVRKSFCLILRGEKQIFSFVSTNYKNYGGKKTKRKTKLLQGFQWAQIIKEWIQEYLLS